MGRTRSFALAAVAALSLLAGASASVHAQDLLDTVRPSTSVSYLATVATAPVGAARAAVDEKSGPNRAPFAIVGLLTLGAGAVLLRRAPKLVS